jgi:hypothetical protein
MSDGFMLLQLVSDRSECISVSCAGGHFPHERAGMTGAADPPPNMLFFPKPLICNRLRAFADAHVQFRQRT